MMLAGTLQSRALQPQVAAASPFQTGVPLSLSRRRSSRVDARGGIPSLERSLGDPETSQVEAWRDSRSRYGVDRGERRQRPASD